MRRQRTWREWWQYGVLAVIAMALAWVLSAQLVNLQEMMIELQDLREQLRDQQTEEPAATGGLEIPILEFVAGPEWRFPIADSDYLMLTSPFGYRVSPLLDIEMDHLGLDIAATWRAQVVAVADGVVVEHWPPPDDYWKGHEIHGGYVVIEHANGMKTGYSHLSWSRVHTGNRVRAGEVIGRVGDTGKSDGPHLHVSVQSAEGEYLNPLHWLRQP